MAVYDMFSQEGPDFSLNHYESEILVTQGWQKLSQGKSKYIGAHYKLAPEI